MSAEFSGSESTDEVLLKTEKHLVLWCDRFDYLQLQNKLTNEKEKKRFLKNEGLAEIF